jgi:hypothetical protein
MRRTHISFVNHLHYIILVTGIVIKANTKHKLQMIWILVIMINNDTANGNNNIMSMYQN